MSSEEDDDKPLGASFHAARRPPSDIEEEDDDRSIENRRRRHSNWSKRPHESSNEDGRSWKRARDEPLFAETSKSGVDRKLERAIAEITLDMLEAVRLSQALLLHILEHPRAEDYIIGAYVRYPDLEKVEADGVAPFEAPLLPAQITKIVSLEVPERVKTADGGENLCNHQLTIVQYTQRFDKSLKIRKAKLNVEHVNNEPFLLRELEQWQELLKLFSGRVGAEKLQTLPQVLPETAERLKSFTFTDEDVNAILQKRMEQQEGLAKGSTAQTLNWRDLYLKKAELEFQISELQADAELSEEAEARLDAAQQELSQVKHNLDILRKEESSKKEPTPGSGTEPQPLVAPAVVTRQSRRTAPPAGADSANMLTPRFLQQKSGTTGAGRVVDWSALEGAHHFTRVSWMNPTGKLDSFFQIPHASDHKEWLAFKKQLKQVIRDEKAASLTQDAKAILKSKVDLEDNAHRVTLAKINGLFKLPFTAPATNPKAEIVNLNIKTMPE
eukprot:Blabericola_migrator_1__5967@NODE_3006_length_2121_cov_196_280915_g1880_i0_p1_GENE_NODE_3006_length_2121_cov_196_280915_g1880_i0NODE_3006_length_2121_cov_196_280915_g1880_i0_p1_ORF_typecomplete_len499_score124_02Plus3/PF03126_18/3_6e07YscOlike/PF16789_5/0_013_NODE_3006_length_2121_cov_196_280915_g1880_i05422038